MNTKPGKPDEVDAIDAIAERAERGEDVSAHFTQHYTAKQRVNVDFPLALLREIDAECGRIGVTRHAWIKMACAESLRHGASVEGQLHRNKADVEADSQRYPRRD